MPAIPSTDIVPEAAMRNMFYGCRKLSSTGAMELPALSVEDSGYEAMFRDCVSLSAAPAISAEKVGMRACFGMFLSCSSLVNAPELPATTLASNCY